LIRQFWGEHQIFRIDHYLGKEIVQNILVFRFANSIFEPLWNRQHIDHIQISVCESIGVEDRADYFDSSGITRDIVQNHVLQMLSLLCIEPPSSLADADSIRSEKVKVLKSMRRLSPEQVRARTVRAQYLAGEIAGKQVTGYQDLKGVKHGSLTESYVAMQLEVDNWRWAGVPIYVRAGKCLTNRVTSISIFFKRPPLTGLKGAGSSGVEPNVLVIEVQPNEGISLRVNSKMPGLQMKLQPVDMDFTYRGAFSEGSADAYERLLLDVFKGDATLFTRDDEIEQAWELIDPVLNTWAVAPYIPLYYYQAGGWGPKEADLLLAKNGHHWLNF
jgi:glucose-6-phosphate 1-dehydrogenase